MFTVPIKKVGHEPFIDYLKGVSILFVVLTHCLPLQNYLLCCLWSAQAVPIFLNIQAIHVYRGGGKNRNNINIKKLFKRILKPFFFVLTVQFLLLICVRGWENVYALTKQVIAGGGIGPGSYYVWIYLQFYFLLPFLMRMMRGWSEVRIGCFFVILSIAMEILCSYADMPGWLYRLLAFRYLFLIYLGYLWVTKGIILNTWTIILSGVSIVFLLLLMYTNIDWEPWLCDSDWKIFHWPAYFYAAYLFPAMLYVCYKHLGSKLNDLLCRMGKYSYEIFLLQMFVFTFLPSAQRLDIIDNIYLTTILRVVLSTILSIAPVLLYKRYQAAREAINS